MSQSMEQMVESANRVLIQNYARQPIVMQRGEGSWLWDAAGKRYLDLFAGFGGGILGHAHPALVEAVRKQAGELWHVGNTFHTQPQIELAEKLNRHAFQGQAFFAHSGADANEAAVKLARLRGMKDGGKRWKTISLIKSFHGRTLAMIAATGNAKVREGFGPPVPGFTTVDPLDYDALVKAIDDETCCVIMEPIQGEGGVNVYPEGHVARVRKLCDEKGLTLIFDEVWTGCGRTGKWFAHQYFTDEKGQPVRPDIMTLGKAVGGGLPVGVMFARPELAKLMVPGKHGSTLGGNLICMAASKAIFEVIERENLLASAAELGELAMAKVRNSQKIQSRVQEVRGRGLFLGIELQKEPRELVERALARGLVINVTAQKVIRLAPPINIRRQDWEQGLDGVIELIAETE